MTCLTVVSMSRQIGQRGSLIPVLIMSPDAGCSAEQELALWSYQGRQADRYNHPEDLKPVAYGQSIDLSDQVMAAYSFVPKAFILFAWEVR